MLLPVAALAAPDRFDLICTGTVHSATDIKGYVPPPRTAKFVGHFRVDLVAGRFCDGICRFLMPVTHADAKEIVYDYRGKGIYPDETLWWSARSDHFFVARDSFAFRRTIKAYYGDAVAFPVHETFAGSCEQRPFSAFPKDARDTVVMGKLLGLPQ